MSEISPAQAAYEAWQRVRFPGNPVPWGHPALGTRARNAWDAAVQAGAAPLREQLAVTTDMLGVAVNALREIADRNDSAASSSTARATISIVEGKISGDYEWKLVPRTEDDGSRT